MNVRRKPTPGCCFGVLLAVLLLYPVSFGPACWIASRCGRGGGVVTSVYRPLTWSFDNAESNVVGDALWRYAHVGATEDWRWMPVIPDQGTGWEWVYWPRNPPP